tara:strand:- start:261 stop:923 length:663 start_codon:yes stop_codon:yes gene_type:complete
MFNIKTIKSINNLISNKTLKKNKVIKKCITFPINTNQIILMVGNKTCPHNNSDQIPLKILESYLSYGMTSLLFQIFREKHALTYDVGIYYPQRKLESPFLIYLSVSENKATLALELIIKIWENLLNKKLTNSELYLSKLKLKTSTLKKYQTIEELLNRKIQLIGYNMDPYFDFNITKKIDSTTSEEILKVSQKYFHQLFLSLCGNKKIIKNLEKLWLEKY